jgi:hypothetical protein
MKISASVHAAMTLATLLTGATCASANPSMLPKHPGYPMGQAVDPVNKQSLANDPGQHNAVGGQALMKAAISDVDYVEQRLDPNRLDKRILEKPGAGLLPKVDGPPIVIAPPVKQATKANAGAK